LIWMALLLGVDRYHVRRAACECARSVFGLVPDDETLRKAVDGAEAWARGTRKREPFLFAAPHRVGRDAADSGNMAAAFAGSSAMAAGEEPAMAAFYSAVAQAALRVPEAFPRPWLSGPHVNEITATRIGGAALSDAHARCADLVRACIPTDSCRWP